jgi:CubicO group peptidase (beta-lactamase class C family)
MSLPRSAPSAQGVDASLVLSFLDAVQERGIDLHSLAIARHGHAVARGWWQPYAADRVQLLYSVSKSLTATAIGFLVQEGRLGLGDPILRHLPDPGRDFHERWRHVTVRHCLTMTVGHDVDAWGTVVGQSALSSGTDGGGVDWVRLVLGIAPDHEPGTTFTYNQVATYLLSAAITHLTGQRVAEVLRPRLFDPLGIDEVWWHSDPWGRDLGFTGAHLTTDDLLSFTQFCLDRGRWRGRSLLREAWFDEASRPFGPANRDPAANPDWNRGYGYSFWSARHGYRGDGAFGQFAIVLPERDAAIAITSQHTDMQEILDLVWEHLLPALGGGGNATADAQLESRLASLVSRPLGGGALGPEFAAFGRSEGAVGLPAAYAAVSVRRDGPAHLLGLERNGEWLEVRVGEGEWLESVVVADGLQLPLAASGGWVDEDLFRAEVLVIETPHRFRVEARLRSGDADLVWAVEPLMGRDPLWLAVRRSPTNPTSI